MPKSKAELVEGEQAWQNFCNFTRRILSVPAKAIERNMEKAQRKRAKERANKGK